MDISSAPNKFNEFSFENKKVKNKGFSIIEIKKIDNSVKILAIDPNDQS